MIIDSHAHVGLHETTQMTLSQILESMEKYNIDFTLASSAEGEEYNGSKEKLQRMNQVDLNRLFINETKKHKDKIGACLWLKVRHEKVTKELEELIESEREFIYAIKIHPFHSQLPFNDERMIPYFELAKKFNLPIVTHTAGSYESSPALVAEVAKKYPTVKFVLVHMGLGTDNLESIQLVKDIDNLYGDTTWVTKDKTVLAVKTCGLHKIMFGTDNPISGVDTIGGPFYRPFFTELKNELSDDEYEHLMYKNAKKVFDLNF